MIINDFHAKIDLNQNDRLQKLNNAIFQLKKSYQTSRKLLIIQDSSNIIKWEIDFIQDDSSFNRDQINNHLYFIKKFVEEGMKMNAQKEFANRSINFNSDNSEMFQFRNNSLIFEFIKGDYYFCLKRNKIIRKFRLSDQNHEIQIGYLKNMTVICLKTKYSQNLDIHYYDIARGKVIKSQQVVCKYHRNYILISKNEKYISIGDQLINIKSEEIITYFYSIESQFSDCSNYFSFMDYSKITVFDINKKEIIYKLQNSFLFNNQDFTEHRYRQVQIDFQNQKVIVEDLKYIVHVQYYYYL